MAAFIFLAFIIIPMIEIGLFILIGDEIGLVATLAAIFITAIIGTAMLRAQGIATLRRAQESLARQEMPLQHIFDGACLLFAGALLLTPGFLTDSFGFLLLIPAMRKAIGGSLMNTLKARGQFSVHPQPGHPHPFDHQPPPQRRPGPTIDGDFTTVEETPPLDPDHLDRETAAKPSKWAKSSPPEKKSDPPSESH